MRFKPHITNKQKKTPDPRKPHHEQGLTCDCRQCGKEFRQYHPRHIYCSPTCQWDKEGVAHGPRACNDCGCVDEAPLKGASYVCYSCQKFRVNSKRTDLKRRIPSEIDS